MNNSVNGSNSDHRNLGQSYCSLHRGTVAKLTSPPVGNGFAKTRPAQNDIMTGAALVAADCAAMFAKRSSVHLASAAINNTSAKRARNGPP